MSSRTSFFQALLCMAAMSSCSTAFAQLPPTNMGKFVHTPGDNQYSDRTQLERHPVYQPPPQVRGGGRMQLMRAPAAPKIDVSLEPITCDEPIPPALFPPFPDRLDLPISSSTSGSWLKDDSKKGGGGSGGVTYHQSYGHVPMGGRPDSIYRMAQPIPVGGGGAVPGLTQQGGQAASGSFMDPDSGSAGSTTNSGGNQGYKVRTDAAGGGSYQRIPVGASGGTTNQYQRIPVGAGGGTTNQYQRIPLGSDSAGQSMGNTLGGTSQYGGQPRYTGAGDREMRSLGNEPRLNSGGGQQSPDAPSPVVVTQSSTQDLSLPEDNSSYQYRPANKSSNFGKGFGKIMKGPMNMVPLGF